jgi:hypothetical protein
MSLHFACKVDGYYSRAITMFAIARNALALQSEMRIDLDSEMVRAAYIQHAESVPFFAQRALAISCSHHLATHPRSSSAFQHQ